MTGPYVQIVLSNPSLPIEYALLEAQEMSSRLNCSVGFTLGKGGPYIFTGSNFEELKEQYNRANYTASELFAKLYSKQVVKNK